MNADALRAEIVANPGDDASRLVFADWLEDEGDVQRAEFIRLQCRLARCAVPAIDDELRADDLFDAHGADWRAELPTLEGIRFTEFERGFPAWIEADDLEAGARNEESMLATTARKWRIKQEEGKLPAGWPGYAGMAGLELEFDFWPFDPEQMSILAASPHASGLTTLAIRYSDFDSASLALLAGSPQFARLRRLDLTNHLVCVEGIRALGRSETLTGLRSLELSHDVLTEADHNRFDTRALIELSRAASLAQLQALRLCPFSLTREGFSALAESPYLGNLRSLGLATGNLQDGAIEPLLGSSLLAGLEKLDLRELHLSFDDLQRLLLSPRPANLFTMALDVDRYGAAGIRALMDSPWGAGLTELLLDGPTGYKSLDDLPSLAFSSGAGSLSGLQQLYLCTLHVSDESLQVLARAGLDKLASLHLGYTTALTAAGVRALADAPGLPSLRRLKFSGGCLGGEVVAALDGGALASRLVFLDLSHQRLSADDVRPFLDRSRWPRLNRLVLSKNFLGRHNCSKLIDCWGEAIVVWQSD